MKERLLEIAYREHKESPFLDHEQFECLIALIEWGDISNIRQLREYGFGDNEPEFTLVADS
jgi:hypothetical protein